ncbi:MAG: hypothetical protein V4443_05685 [Pseudomonadota bacterium]
MKTNTFKKLTAGLTILLVSALISEAALAQTVTRIRGTITGYDTQVMAVKTREGKDLKIKVSDDTSISSVAPMQMSDIKPGSFVGVTAVKKGPDNTQQALEVHVFPEAARGTGEGHREWDLEPGSTMTNANVDATVDSNNGKELTLSYKGGQQKITVPAGTPIVTFVPGDKSQLKAGAEIFTMAQQAADGTVTAQRIVVGSQGIKPPM